MTGSKRERPELEKLLEQLREDDVIIVTKYDRLSRSLRDLIDIVGRIAEAGAGFKSIAEDIDLAPDAPQHFLLNGRSEGPSFRVTS